MHQKLNTHHLHIALRQSLDDLERCEQDDRYEIDMAFFHTGSASLGRCHVCLAGSVMAQRLYVDIGARSYPRMFPLQFGTLHALDYLRTGEVVEAYRIAGQRLPHGVSDREIVLYRKDPAGFKSALRALADELEAALRPTLLERLQSGFHRLFSKVFRYTTRRG